MPTFSEFCPLRQNVHSIDRNATEFPQFFYVSAVTDTWAFRAFDYRTAHLSTSAVSC